MGKQIVRKRAFLGRLMLEISDNLRHVAFHLNDENFLVISKKDGRTAVGGQNAANLNQSDLRAHRGNLRCRPPIDKHLPPAAGFAC